MLRILFSLLLVSTLPLVAQPGTERKISLNLCCLRYAGEARSLMLKSSPSSAPNEVAFYQGGFTEPVPALVENGRVVVYKKGAEGQPPWISDWSFAVPGSGTEVSAILLPTPPKSEPTAPYTAFLLPTAKDFDYGSVLAVNLTPLNARLDLGTKKLSLPPGASSSAKLESETDAYNMVPVTAWIQNDGKWLTLHTTQWSYNERYRQVSLIWMDASAKRPEITSIRDVRPILKPGD
jgi:hypothetical protein